MIYNYIENKDDSASNSDTGSSNVGNKQRKAISLEYDGIRTPRVSAIGKGEVADEILRIATEHEVPIYKDEALAGVLSELELQSEIPATLFLAVAEVLVFTYQLQDLMWVDEV
jgi:flagellar biosynthesis protein